MPALRACERFVNRPYEDCGRPVTAPTAGGGTRDVEGAVPYRWGMIAAFLELRTALSRDKKAECR